MRSGRAGSGQRGSSGRGSGGHKPEPKTRRVPAPRFGASVAASIRVRDRQAGESALLIVPNPQREALLTREVRLLLWRGAEEPCTLSVYLLSPDGTLRFLLHGVEAFFVYPYTVYDSTTDGDENCRAIQYMGAEDWLVVSVEDGNANGLEAEVYFDYRTLRGGSGQR